ncbi:uncharacterized protein LOC127284953 [Leptopilina boulardi]|uniref:uncharacterized protein LOC127284953 n=1 Tax=Leptopilina boulardi TaxID=63433 RepID=UPI0021F58AFA|nr:uncharacterized protein LOC127284953 [Leptopilina boulardi]
MEEIKYVKEIFQNYFKDELKSKEIGAFYVNTCQTCHCLDKLEKRLKRCSGCHMISYCDTEHQAKHWPIHKKLCKIVKQIISTNGGNSIFGNTKGLDKKNWVKLKMNTMLIVSLKIGRELTTSEKDMFLFPRICCICHDSNPRALTNCLDCGNSSFCNDHISDARHKIICSSFALGYKLNLFKMFTSNINILEIISILLDKNPINCIPFAVENYNFLSMRQFIDIFFHEIINNHCQENMMSSDFWEIFIADYFTRPLTLLSAIKLINYKVERELIIHIIGSYYLELNGIFAWEIIFHLMTSIEKLTIILIGPGLVEDKIMNPQLCENCQKLGKFINVIVDNNYYHEFMNEEMRPNLIIGYNLGISEYENPGSLDDTWQLTILKIVEINVPFIMTCYTEGEAHKDHERINYFLKTKSKTNTNYTILQRNKFASLTPFRDFETEGVFYQNDYLIVYNNWQKLIVNN